MNLPNKITLTRICMIPLFVAVFFLDDVLPYNYFIAAAIFVLAACTDFIDGYIARKYKLVTNLGKFLDPIADKVLVFTAMVLLLTMRYYLQAFGGFAAGYYFYVALTVCICVIMARELMVSAFRQIAATKGVVMAADKLGKYKTACQDVSIFVLLATANFGGTLKTVCGYTGLLLFALATLLTVWSGIAYLVKNKHVFKDE